MDMNINTFFVTIFIGLGMIFTFFKPLNIKTLELEETPLLEIESFTLYELDTLGMSTLAHGENGLRFEDRYVIKKMDYTDNSKTYKATMYADDGVYQGDVVKLKGNIIYNREDGITFKTQEAHYNKLSKIAMATAPYIAHMGKNTMKGSFLEYNNEFDTMKSKNINVLYYIKKEKL